MKTEAERSTPWLQVRPADELPRLRLFCLPHAGSGALTFRAWNSTLPSFIQVCPVMLPGRESRLSEAPFREISTLMDALTQELCPWLDRPYAIFGHSMGALLAFEWARHLRRRKEKPPVSLFLSGRCAPDTEPSPHRLQALPDGEFITELNRRYEGIPSEILRESDLLEFYLPILRADIEVVESYQFKEESPLESPMTVFAGVKDPSVTWDQLLAWKRHTNSRFAAQLFPGGHFYPHGPLLSAIAAAMTEWTLINGQGQSSSAEEIL